MMKKIIAIFTCVLLLSMLALSAVAAQSATFSVAASKTTVNRDDTITVTVSTSAVENCTSGGFMFNFDKNVFEYVSGSSLSGLSGYTAGVSTAAGNIAGYFMNGNATVQGNLFQIVLKVKSSAAFGTYNISGTPNLTAADGAVSCSAGSVSVKIICATHSLGDSYTQANATQHTRTCSACGYVETTSHTWDAGSVTKNADCKETGTKHYECTAKGCVATKDEPIPTTENHETFGSWSQTSAPGCTTVGKESRTCTTCQKVETRDVAATGHSMGGWNQTTAPGCTTPGVETNACSKCSHKETRPVNALGHAFSNPTVTKQPTCTEAGEKSGKCTRCNQTTTEAVAATGHKMGSWTTTKEATCTEKGEENRACSNNCGHKETRATDALGHKFANATVTKQPTCTEKGEETGKCTRCGKETTNTIKATGHKFGEWQDTKAATCTEKGAQERQCSKCQSKETRETEALGHDFDNPVIVKEPTLTEKGIQEGVCKACGEKTQSELPCAFKDETTGIEIETQEGVFEAGTEIKIEVIEKEHASFETVKTALKKVASKFVAYDVAAIRENAVVQPNGSLTLSFKIPEGFGKNIAIFYINDEGVGEKLESAVSEDGTSISATLTHFSSYAVVELAEQEDEPENNKGDNNATTGTETPTPEEGKNPTGVIIAICLILLGAGGAAAYYFFIFKKK